MSCWRDSDVLRDFSHQIQSNLSKISKFVISLKIILLFIEFVSFLNFHYHLIYSCPLVMQGVPNIINEAIGNSNPMGQIAAEYALRGVNDYIGKMQISGYTNKVFSPEMRSYFDVDTTTVGHKLLKLLVPFKHFDFDDQIKKLDLYLPIVSFMTLIMFSTLLEGITTEKFTPSIGKRVVWISIFTALEVLLAKFTENVVANLNLGVIQMLSLVSYRFVSLSAVVFLLVITSASIPFLSYLGAIYALVADTYYCHIELSNCCRQRFKEQGLGNRIALAVHAVTTVVIMWYSSIL